MITFRIGEALPVLNQFAKLSHWERAEIRSRVRLWARVGLNSCQHWPGTPPLARCRIRIIRVGAHAIDPDGLPTCAKHILDVLQPQSKRHPDGLGVIAEDSLECIVGGAQIEQRRTKPGERPHMLVEIEALS